MSDRETIKDVDEILEFDQVLKRVGDNGRFQKRFNCIFNVGLVIFASMIYYNIILALSAPDHWCHVPGREQTNYTLEEWKRLTLPRYEKKLCFLCASNALVDIFCCLS